MPVRRRTRQPRGLQRENQADVTEPDLGHQLAEPQPALARRTRTAHVLIDDRDRRGRPSKLDGALPQRILARRRLGIALDLPERRLTHIHDRAPAPMRLRDLPALTPRARPPPTCPATAPDAPSPRAGPPAATSPTPPPPPPPTLRSPPAPTGPTPSPR